MPKRHNREEILIMRIDIGGGGKEKKEFLNIKFQSIYICSRH